jgi:DNA-binding transcriptional MerR regulator
MRIGELSRRTGASVRSLRYYEEQGLISSVRTSGGHRTYEDDAVDRVALVQLLFRAGVTSRDVVQIMPCIHSGTTTPDMIERLSAERARIDEKARDLLATRDRMDAVLVDSYARLRA